MEPSTFAVNVEAETLGSVDDWVQSRLDIEPKREPGIKIFSQKAVLYWLQGGKTQNIRKERKTYRLDQSVINKTRKVVNFKKIHLYEDEFIVWNENTRGKAKRYESLVDAHTLHLFTLAFF